MKISHKIQKSGIVQFFTHVKRCVLFSHHDYFFWHKKVSRDLGHMGLNARNQIFLHANNKGKDHSAHQTSLFRAFDFSLSVSFIQ